MFLKKLSIVLFVVFVFDRVFTSERRCVGRGHIALFGQDGCCKNQSVTPGIGTSEQWKKCAVAPSDDDETYSATMWRIYTCMLKMVVPKDQETISLIEFGKAMTAEYPETLKAEINDKLKDSKSQDKEESSAGVDFKNIEMINRLRSNYFDIEEQICGIDIYGDDFAQPKNMTGIGCPLSHEMSHLGGSCCNNKSLPIDDHEFNRIYPQNCNNTLSKFKEKLEAINSTWVNYFLFECEVSCYLVQNEVFSVEDLISFNVTNDIMTEKILKKFMPKYYSETVQKKVQSYIKTSFNFTAERTRRHLPEELHGCLVHIFLHHFSSAPESLGCY